jgi:hypothetical protein
MVSHGESHFVSGLSEVEMASGMVARVEDILSQRDGLSLENARLRVAHTLKVPPRTLLHIRNQRRKTITWRFMEALRAMLIEILQSEIVRLEHELYIQRQIAGSHRSDDLAAAEAQVVEAKKILRAATR